MRLISLLLLLWSRARCPTPERTHYITIMRVYFSLFTTKNGVSIRYTKMVCHYILFFAIIRYYGAIMTLIAIIAIIALFSVVEVSME